MKIFYYFWNENSKDDCVESMERLGHTVTVWEHPVKNYAEDPEFSSSINAELDKCSYDCIFSFNYFPLLSEAALKYGIPYYSWVYDSPHHTLESVTLGNECNHVYIFDYALAELYRSKGFDTVDYMPLGVNIVRLDNLISSSRCGKDKYGHDITFIGSLYNDGYNFYDQIGYLPDYLKGYMDAIIKAQESIYGMDLASQMLTPDICDKIGQYVKADLGKGFNSVRNEIFRDMLRKKTTINERRNLLSELGNHFSVDLYSGSAPSPDMKVKHMGTVDYYSEMPVVFASSKINLNITLRSILTGIPLRVVDILGAGGFCLTNYQAELAEYFENEKELVWFESREDMIDKADFYLKNDDLREKIALTGHEAASRLFSYDVLLPKFLG